MVDRITRITYRNRLFIYPVKPIDCSRSWTCPCSRAQIDCGQDTREVALRVKPMSFGRGDQAPRPGLVGGCGVVAGEQPIFSTQGYARNGRPTAGASTGIPRGLT